MQDTEENKESNRQWAVRSFCILLSAFRLLPSGLFGGSVKTKRRTEITVETDRVFVIRRRSGSVLAWCAECAALVKMITPDEAAALAGISSRTIYHWIESEQIHFTETAGGQMLVCFNSLAASVKQPTAGHNRFLS